MFFVQGIREKNVTKQKDFIGSRLIGSPHDDISPKVFTGSQTGFHSHTVRRETKYFSRKSHAENMIPRLSYPKLF